MKTIIPPLQINDQDKEVANLQDVLEALGFTIDIKEKKDQLFDGTTAEAVENFQAKTKLEVNGIVDTETADMLNKAMHEQGLFVYKVSGKVSNRFGEVLAKKEVAVYDIDLRAAGIYSTTVDPADIRTNGGFQHLGSTTTNEEGYYEVTFNQRQFNHAEKELADVIAYVIENEVITGRSILATKKKYTNGIEVNNLNITLTNSEERGTSEYSRLVQAVTPLLTSSELVLADLFGAQDQIRFLAVETEQNTQHVYLLVKAAKLWELHTTTRIPGQELFYGIGRQNIRLEWHALAVTKENRLSAAITKAIQANIISAVDDATITNFLALIKKTAGETILRDEPGTAAIPVGKVLGFSLKEPALQATFINAYINFEGTPEQFWKAHLPLQPGFENRPELIQSLQLTNQLLVLSVNHIPLVEELQVIRGITSPMELLQLSTKDWQAIIKKTGVPEAIRTSANVEAVDQYIEEMRGILNAAYPTQKIALMVRNNEISHEDETITAGLNAFFAQATTFDFSKSRVEDFNEVIVSVANGRHLEVKLELQKIQRLYQVSPTPETMVKLINIGFKSAFQMANIPKKSFLAMYTEKLGGEEKALAVFNRANYQALRLQNVALTVQEMVNGANPAFTTYH